MVRGRDAGKDAHSSEAPDTRVLAADLDLFTERAVNASHRSTKYVEIPTLSSLRNKELSMVEFDIPPTDNYLDLKRTQLLIKLRLWRRKGATGALEVFQPAEGETAPSPCNMPLAAIVERMELLLGSDRVQVNPTDSIYGARTYAQTLMCYGQDAKESHLQEAGYVADEFGIDLDSPEQSGYTQRAYMFYNGATVCLRGYLNCPIMQQSKLLLNQCAMRLVLHLKAAKYCLQYRVADPNDSVVYEIVEAKLRVCNVQVDPSIQLGHEAALASGATAKYNVMQPITNHHTIAAGARNFSYQNLFAGDVPPLLYIFFQSAERFEGSPAMNCFKFEHANVERITLTANGEVAPAGIMKFDMENDDYLDGFDSIFTGTGVFNRDVGCRLPRQSFKHGYALFVYDLSRNGEGACSEIRDTDGVGNVSIDVQFSKPVAAPLTMTVVGYIKTQLQINRERQVVKLYR